MPVGTRGAVKALDSADLERAGRRGGAGQHLPPDAAARAPTSVAALGGLHRFTGWDGHTLTDSGGFQVHSLRPKVDDDGVTFASVYDGAPDPAHAGDGRRGPGPARRRHPDGARRVRLAARRRPRSCAWPSTARPPGRRGPGPTTTGSRPGPRARRSSASSRAAPTRPCGSRAPERTVALDFDGYGIGGLSVGEPRHEMLEALAATVPELPADRPALPDGRGGPGGHAGVDRPGRRPVRLRGADPGGPARFDLDVRRVGSTCATPPTPATTGRSTPTARAPTCARWSRGLPAAPPAVGEPTAWRLCSIHNLAYVLGLMDRARAAIAAGTLEALVARTREVWDR